MGFAQDDTLDARHLGLNTHVMLDGCRGIELELGDIGRAARRNETRRSGPSKKQRSVAGGADSGSRDQRPRLRNFVRE
jgi:hypothetical protein